MADLSRINAADLDKYRQVWAFSTDEMNVKEQQVLVDYTRGGGNLVIFPYLPDREMSQKSCTILRDSISISPSGSETIDSPLIDLFDLKDLKCANPQIIYREDSMAGAKVIARTIRDSVCGFEITLGQGKLIHLGTWLGFDTEGHKPAYEALLKRSGAMLRQASATSETITVRERFTDEGSAVLFIGNYYNEEQRGKVTYTHPATGDSISIPLIGGEMHWPALYGILTPLCMKIDDGISILHCTSDILKIVRKVGLIEISLFGDRDLAGEIVFEGNDLSSITGATIDGDEILRIKNKDRIIFNYHHKHNKEIIIQIYL
jgi:beta-galactosidase